MIESARKRSYFTSNRFLALLVAASSLIGVAATLFQRWKLDVDTTLAPIRTILTAYQAQNSADPRVTAEVGAALERISNWGGTVLLPSLVFLVTLLVSVVQYRAAGRKDEIQAPPASTHKLFGPLVMLEILMRQQRDLKAGDNRFRATLHRIDVKKDEHEQCLPYVGFKGGDQQKIGRAWTNHCGLVGMLARANADSYLKTKMDESVKTHDDYVKALIKMFGYKEKQAKEAESMRLSAIAIPIHGGDSKTLEGVLYCDSSERGFFDDEATCQLCVHAGMSIASLVRSNNN